MLYSVLVNVPNPPPQPANLTDVHKLVLLISPPIFPILLLIFNKLPVTQKELGVVTVPTVDGMVDEAPPPLPPCLREDDVFSSPQPAPPPLTP